MSSADFNQVARLERNLFSYDFPLSGERLIKKLENLRDESSINNLFMLQDSLLDRLWLICPLERLNHWNFKLSRKVQNSLFFQNKFCGEFDFLSRVFFAQTLLIYLQPRRS